MPPLPKKRTSRARKGDRRSHMSLKPAQLVVCTQCRTLKPSHHVCPICGYYKGRQVLSIPTQ